MSVFWRDWLERVLWTLAQAVLAVLIQQTADLPYQWVPLLTMGLSMVKGLVAKKIGDTNSASLGGDPKPVATAA